MKTGIKIWVKDNLKILDLSKDEVVIYGYEEDCGRNRFDRGNHTFGLGHSKFVISLRHPGEDVK